MLKAYDAVYDQSRAEEVMDNNINDIVYSKSDSNVISKQPKCTVNFAM